MPIKWEGSTHRALLPKSSSLFLKTDLCVFISCITTETLCWVTAEAFVKMSKDVTIGSSTLQPTPINKLPTEILIEIFETYAKSYPEVRDERVGDLCLVSKYWNAVAHNTPHLWTKINLSFPFSDDHLDAARKRIRASKFEKIDVFIDFCDPEWDAIEPSDGEDGEDQPVEAIWVHKVLTLLRDTEERWETIEVVSLTWLPLYKLIEGWTFTHLPSLKSILMERKSSYFSLLGVSFVPPPLIGPMTLFGQGASLPKLHDLSLSGVHVDWDDILASYRNLCKLELKNLAFDVAPSFKQFAEMLSSSPRLEYLDVSGFCPEHHTEPAPAAPYPKIPVVYLPVLRDFIFGWKKIHHGRRFLQMFQIGSSLETLALVDTESSFGCYAEISGQYRHWAWDSREIFETLHDLGLNAPQDEGDIPPGPFISMRGVKRLEIISTEATRFSLIPFITMLTELECIWLENVDRYVLEDIVSVLVGGNETLQPLRRLDLLWPWYDAIPDFAEPLILQLESAGIAFTAHAGGF